MTITFRHLPVYSLDDVTHNFEQLSGESFGAGKEGKAGPAGAEGKTGPAGPIVKLEELTAHAHSELTGLTTGDPHTQYALGAGRAAGQELVGGTELEHTLTLKSNSATPKTQIVSKSPINIEAVAGASGAGLTLVLGENTLSSAASSANFIRLPLTLTMSAGVTVVRALLASGTVTYSLAQTGSNALQLFRNEVALKSAHNMKPTISFSEALTFSPTATGTTNWGGRTVGSAFTLNEPEGAGTATATNGFVGLTSSLTINKGWTVPYRRVVSVANPNVTESTLEEDCALYVENLTSATVNLSIKSLGTSVQMRHAGPVKLGANEAPSAGYTLDVAAGDVALSTLGKCYRVKEGENAKMGMATLNGGASAEVTVSTTAVTASSRIFLEVQGGTLTHVGAPYVKSRVAGEKFVIGSTASLDASEVAWLILEPA